jgi:hypothetical protein
MLRDAALLLDRENQRLHEKIFGLVTKLHLWPRLRMLECDDALVPLLVPHPFRFIGLSFLVPGVVSPSLASAFATPAAYGDLLAAILVVAAILAVAASIALSGRVPDPPGPSPRSKGP